jgi:hypothetical protein
MSWGFSATGVTSEDVLDKLKESERNARTFSTDKDRWPAAVKRQIDAAYAAVEALLPGMSEEKFNVSLSGHAKVADADYGVPSMTVSIGGVYEPEGGGG